jgi:outer membrane receptor for ferrienterochelin and colicins
MRCGRIRAAVSVCGSLVLGAGTLTAQQSRDSVHRDSLGRAHRLAGLVVTASRRLQASSDAPVATQVIDRAAVERSGAQDLQALLTQYVGIEPEPSVVGSGGVQLEGLSSEHVLVLIDGQPLVGRIDGELDLSRVPAQIIDRVEVIRGPLSTLYGSSAMGGVINVITRDPAAAPPGFSLRALSGSQHRTDADADLSTGIGPLRGTFDIGRRIDDVQPGRADQSAARARRWDGNARVHWSPGAHGMAIDAALLGVSENQRWQDGQLFYFSDNTQADARLSASTVAGANGLGKLVGTLYYSDFAHLSRQATLPEPVSDSGDQSSESLARAEVTYTAPVTTTQVLDAGIDIDRDALTSDRISSGHRTSLEAEPYAQYTVTVGHLALVPGMRVSSSDQWGTHVTPKVAALMRLPAGFALRASVGSGYRAPAFKELYLTFLNAAVGYVVHGNPDLRPETSVNVAAGLEWTTRRAYAQVQAYTNHFSQFIESVQLADSGSVEQYTYGNVASGTTRGIDVNAGVVVRRVSVDASYGRVYARDQTANVPLLGVTPQSFRLSAHTTGPAGLQPSVTLLYWAAAPASQSTLGFTTVTTYRAAFTRVDAQLARTVGGGVDVQVGVQNVFGARPLDWPGITARQIYAGATLTHGF